MLRSLPLPALIGLSALAAAQTAPPSATRAPPAPGEPATRQAGAVPPAPTPAEVNAKLAAPLPADQAAIKAHVMFLASDAMRGREAGSHEFDIAAEYVAAQFYAAGLRPGGDAGGYLQHVPLTGYRPAGEGRLTWTPTRGRATPLVFGEDYVPVANPAKAATAVAAPVVFVGRGIDAPGQGVDDYAGVDVRGKIVAFFGGAPDRLDPEQRAFFSQAGTKAWLAERRGAIGAITLDTPGGGRQRPFAQVRANYAANKVTWARGDGTGAATGGLILATLSHAGATRLFAGASVSYATLLAQARDPDARFRAMPLAGTLGAETRTSFTPGTSENVVGILPGSDPALSRQVVVLSAHLDHIGVGAGGGGDRINNGALDNAIGIASLIEEARRFTAGGKAPKRTLMFLAVTGEEKGLVGSDYFARHPTVPVTDIVANVNLDMPILTYRFEDMIVYGAERSTLGPIVRRAVNGAGVDLSPDPAPGEAIFVRSDHFRFVQQGIPSVFLWPGQKGPGKAAFVAFMTNCYHKPCDALASLDIDWSQGPRFVDVNYRIAREIADGRDAPVWNKGDYFGTLYRGPMAAK